MGRCIPPPPPAMGCNRNRPDINTTTVGDRGGTGGLCIPVVIAPSRRTRRGGGVGKWTSVTPRGRKPIFPHPISNLLSQFGKLKGTVPSPPPGVTIEGRLLFGGGGQNGSKMLYKARVCASCQDNTHHMSQPNCRDNVAVMTKMNEFLL